MEYEDTILSKLESLISSLEKAYDRILKSDYRGDITKVTYKRTLNDDDEFFLQMGKDLEYITLVRDKLSVDNTVLKSDLIDINGLYKKYKSSGDIK